MNVTFTRKYHGATLESLSVNVTIQQPYELDLMKRFEKVIDKVGINEIVELVERSSNRGKRKTHRS